MMIVISSTLKNNKCGERMRLDDTSSANQITRFAPAKLRIIQIGAERGNNLKAHHLRESLKRYLLPGQLHAEAVLENQNEIPNIWLGKCIMFPGTKWNLPQGRLYRIVYIRHDTVSQRWVFCTCRSDQKLLPHFYAVVFHNIPKT